MLEALVGLLTLVPLDATPMVPSQGPQQPVQPSGGNGFAAYILGGFFALGLLTIAMVLISLKPKRHDPRDVRPPRRSPNA